MGVFRRGGGSRSRTANDGDAGFAAVDALVALTILSSTLILALQALTVTHRAAAAALETRKANALMASLMVEARKATGLSSGETGALRWQVRLEPSEVSGICSRSVNVEGLRSRRRFALATREPCPAEAKPA